MTFGCLTWLCRASRLQPEYRITSFVCIGMRHLFASLHRVDASLFGCMMSFSVTDMYVGIIVARHTGEPSDLSAQV